jgi:DsbC/DsbD-like thiol-disulfide interchange protein
MVPMRPSRRFGPWLLATAFLLGSPHAASAAAETKPKAPQVRVELIAEQDGIQPGATFWVGLRQRIAPGWHTYWSNPGDSGEPTTIDWTLPSGFKAGEIVWPHPERIPLGPAMSFGYSGETVLLTEMTAPSDLEPGKRVTLHGRASWLVCAKICIPEEADVRLTLPVVSAKPSINARGATAIAQARRAVPATGLWPASFTATPETVVLTVAATGLSADRIAEAWFYPSQWGVIDLAAPQEVEVGARAMTLRMAR